MKGLSKSGPLGQKFNIAPGACLGLISARARMFDHKRLRSLIRRRSRITQATICISQFLLSTSNCAIGGRQLQRRCRVDAGGPQQTSWE